MTFSVHVMTAAKDPSLTLRLQRLYKHVMVTIEEGARVDSQHALHSKLMMEVAQNYSDILGEAASLMVVPDSAVVIDEALRVASRLLAFDSHGDHGTSTATETGATFIGYVLEGIEQLVKLFPSNHGLPLPKPSREELIAVVRLLLFPVVQQRSELDPTASFNLQTLCSANVVAEVSLPQHAWRDRRLVCARLLTERGLPRCRDVEELLSSSCVYGGMLQKFLLETIQEEFTVMRRHASGSLTALSDLTDEFGDEAGPSSSSSSSDASRFFYYAVLSVSARGVPTRSGRSASTSSSFSTGCNTPRSRHTGDDHVWQMRSAKSRSGTIKRLVCQRSAAVLWSLAALASLGTAMAHHEEAASQELYDQTSDFVDFAGDLVSVCAVVVRPFLTEHLDLMQQISQEVFPVFSQPQAMRGILQYINEDVASYRRYKDVVQQFLSRWDPAFARVSLPPTKSNDALFASPRETRETSEKRHEEEEKDVLVQGNPALGVEMEKEITPQWEPVAPALAVHLALPILDDVELEVPEVVSLFTEVKQFREAEREVLWTYWARLRGKTTALAAAVARMQQRLNSALESRAMFFSLSKVSRKDFEREWGDQISQRLLKLQQAMRSVQRQRGKQPRHVSQMPQLQR
ncbi:hypothetical protein TraAM80_08169 [Trypanosoma rangeli]|uniref:Uncharacterized protein n=1 Tax=Trypanosoma rangeli TaxID=5698 RepID=A0A3R7KQT6_TRYRA|nr:uncharacterized protein TraAM80_08169 [Trypanosoma rangeli]RNE99558.1 hypothetical protein TraAM80_08169 [Trypanosoma rangeli]|eukprot:RNE99558.1 hypothetical protein TraAM80_08169 [Trypanosoma rangeli]